jgi:hypothetical protein
MIYNMIQVIAELSNTFKCSLTDLCFCLAQSLHFSATDMSWNIENRITQKFTYQTWHDIKEYALQDWRMSSQEYLIDLHHTILDSFLSEWLVQRQMGPQHPKNHSNPSDRMPSWLNTIRNGNMSISLALIMLTMVCTSADAVRRARLQPPLSPPIVCRSNPPRMRWF